MARIFSIVWYGLRPAHSCVTFLLLALSVIARTDARSHVISFSEITKGNKLEKIAGYGRNNLPDDTWKPTPQPSSLGISLF